MKKGDLVKIYKVRNYNLESKKELGEGTVIKITKNFIYVECFNDVTKFIRNGKNKGYDEKLERLKVYLNFYNYIEIK